MRTDTLLWLLIGGVVLYLAYTKWDLIGPNSSQLRLSSIPPMPIGYKGYTLANGWVVTPEEAWVLSHQTMSGEI